METEKSNGKDIIKYFTALIITCSLIAGVYLFGSSEAEHVSTLQMALNSENKQEAYVIFIGMNDKDTYEQNISIEEARELVNNICVNYVDGYTSLEAKGGWVDEKDVLTQEDTLIYLFTGISEEQLKCLMDEVLNQLHQNAIMVEKIYLSYSYYNGTKESDTP